MKKKVLVMLLLFALTATLALPASAAAKTTSKTKSKISQNKKTKSKVAAKKKKSVSRSAVSSEISSPKEIDKIISNAKELIGTPYRSGGTTKAGFDCSGFTRYVFNTVGIELPHSSKAQASIGIKLNRNQLVPGALVYFNTSGSDISHVGIYLGDNKFIDSSNSKGVAINSLNDSYWSSRYVGATLVK